MEYRKASIADAAELAKLNSDLLHDEGHRNTLSIAQLEARMGKYLDEGHVAFIFTDHSGTIGYALFRDDNHDVFLRQFFIVDHARRKGIGREAFNWLCENVWADAERVTLNVLLHNRRGMDFWHSVGLADYCMMMEKRFR